MHHTTPPAPHASFGLEIPDVRLARLTRQALLAATGAAALSVLSQVLELALGSVGGSAVGVSIFGICVCLVVPACGYFGARNSDETMTCCFCGCSLLGASVQLIALLTLWSYVQNIRLMADLCRPQSDGKRDSSCPIEQYELYCKQHNPPLSTNGQCYQHLQGRISHYSSLLTLSAVFSLPAIVLSCVAFCLGRRLWKEIRMGRVVVPLPGAAAPLARRAVQPAPAAQLAAPPAARPPPRA